MSGFDFIAGHMRIIKSLRESIKNNMASHAYIFCGNRGSGRKLTAAAFARALNCTDSTDGDSCGKCRSCRQFDSGNSPDVFYVKAVKTKSIGVDDIREQIVEKVKTKPYSYDKKIFIVDMADTMTVQAQNALLKTLEEPPAYVVIILIAENLENFLPTVLSRCVVMKFRPIPAAQVRKYLTEKCGIDSHDAVFYSEYCGGSIGEALRLSEDSQFFAMREEAIKCLAVIDSMDTASAMLMAKDMEKYRGYPELFDIMYMFYRDVLCYRLFKSPDRLIQKDKTDEIKIQAESLDENRIARRLEAIMNTKKQIKQNAGFQLSVEVLFMTVKEN